MIFENLKKKKNLKTVISCISIIVITVLIILIINKVKNKDELIDTTPPIIVLNDTYTVKKGYSKNLLDEIVSADDVDPNPTREIIGEYNFDEIGEYNLTYKIEDSSGNITTKDFTLKVKESYSYEDKEIKIEDAISNYKTDSTKIGIDVSKWQGEIDWEKVLKSNVEFAIIRMGYQKGFDGDLLVDPYFEKNIEECKKNNITVAIYFSSYAKTADEGEQQAEWINNYLSQKDYGNLYVAFDWENWSSFNGLGMSLNEINSMANRFMKKICENGNKALLYSSKTYLDTMWKNEENFPVWLANYVSKTEYQGKYDIWQFTEKGVVQGISGYVDIDVMY